MEIIQGPEEMSRLAGAARQGGRTIGFVPTMGYLHEGHAALVRRARTENDLVVVSVFVNPLQFGPREDYREYPRDLDRDARLAAEAGADLLFVPEAEQVYPPGYCTFVEVEGLTAGLCGASRPGHFRGVATVVAKLFNLVRPHRAYFGQKDAQQLVVIRRLARDLDLGVQVVAVPTVREPDGLAMSSRNVYLSPAERLSALALHHALRAARDLLDRGERSAAALRSAMHGVLDADPAVRVDYVDVVDAETLAGLDQASDRVLLAVAAYVGRGRLIDNLVLRVEGEYVIETAL